MRLLLPFGVLVAMGVHAQQVLTIQNPSLEMTEKKKYCTDPKGTEWYCPNGVVRDTVVPRPLSSGGIFSMTTVDPWQNCNQSPDLLPNAPELLPSMAASDGNWYFGLICDPQNSPASEAVAQKLSGNFVAGTEYSFKIDLAHAKNYATPGKWGVANGFGAPGKLQLYGNMGGATWGSYRKAGCDVSNDNVKGQLLWTSPDVMNETWQTYEVKFTPKQNWSHIMLSMNDPVGTSTCAINHNNILMDRVGGFVPGGLQVKTPGNNAVLACSQTITGTADKEIGTIDVTGHFLGNKASATIGTSLKDWSISLAYDKAFSGWDTLEIAADYRDVGVFDEKIKVPVYIHPKITDFDQSLTDVTSPVQFSDKSTDLWNKSTTWTWDFGDGQSSKDRNPSHMYQKAGTYDVAQYINYNGDSRCVDTVIKKVIVPGRPIVVTIKNPVDGSNAGCHATVTGTTSDKADSVRVSIGGNQWVLANMLTDTTWTAEVFAGANNSGLQSLIAEAYAPGTRSADTNKVTFAGGSVLAKFDFALNASRDSLKITNQSTGLSAKLDSIRLNLPFGKTANQSAAVEIVKPGLYPISLVAFGSDGCRDQKDTLATVSVAMVDSVSHGLFDQNADGQVDLMKVRLLSNVPQAWLGNMSLELRWPSTIDTVQTFKSKSAHLSWDSLALGQKIRWNMPADLNARDTGKAVYLHPALTGLGAGYGEAYLLQSFYNKGVDSIVRQPLSLLDSMAPLVAKAKLFGAKSKDQADTLRFDFTEVADSSKFKSSQAFGFWISPKNQPEPSLEFGTKNAKLGWQMQGRRLGLILAASERDRLGFTLRPGDSTKALEVDAGLTDLVGNTATERSPWKPLEGELRTSMESLNLTEINPTDDSLGEAFGKIEPIRRNQTLEEIADGRAGTLFHLPSISGQDLSTLAWKYELAYFGTDGQYVSSTRGELKCTDPIFAGRCDNSDVTDFFIPWNHRAQSGRKIGAGAYLERATLGKTSQTKTIGVHR